MKIRNIEKTEEIEGEIIETEWDFKKIGIGFFILIAVLIMGAVFLLPKIENLKMPEKSVLGVGFEDSEKPPLPTKEDITSIINDAKSVLSEITSENLTSSAAAIQKVITDLQKLQENKDAVSAICSLMCKK